ncbi:MAG: hypothetical protein JO091_01270, partial [Acidobacteriaceae bacterium]|nr:hypothetical protein [Acidobacteriaceae bacterium]
MKSIEFERAGSYLDALARAADECGIERQYWDIFGKKHETSPDVQRRILQALGWNVESFESVEAERLRRFRDTAAAVLPKTLVISESDLAIPLTLPASATGALQFDIGFEGGHSQTGTEALANLRPIADVFIDDEQWRRYEFRLPSDL